MNNLAEHTLVGRDALELQSLSELASRFYEISILHL
jgi:hypothetical protein